MSLYDDAERRPITVSEAERKNTRPRIKPRSLEHFPQLAKPFGLKHDEWEELKRQMRAGDELFEFCTAPRTWAAMMGRAGVELVRGGVVVCRVVAVEN